jgi:hypothetical protein
MTTFACAAGGGTSFDRRGRLGRAASGAPV